MPLEEESIAADWKAIQEKHALPEETEPDPSPPAEEPETTETESAAAPGQPRNKDGTFAKPSKESAEAPEPVSKEVAPPEAATPAEQPVLSAKGAPVDITKAPSTWKPIARAEFAKLPEAVRAEIHRRESDALNGQAQLLPDARFGKQVNEVVAPYRHMIEAEGGTPERAIADLLRTAALFRVGSPQAKQQALLGIAKQFNIELPAPAQPGQPPAAPTSPQAFQDPRVDQLLQHLQTQEQQRAQAEQQALESTVTRWMETADEKGQPKYPYLGDVMDHMTVLVPHIRQQNPSLSHEQVLQRAYEQAIWANPDVRPLLQQPAMPANPERVREAKRAASVNVPRRASQPSPAKPGKMEETIENTARELGFFS